MTARRYLPQCPPTGLCAIASCRYHEANTPTGCAIDVANLGPRTHLEIGSIIGVCHERSRQIEIVALRKAHASALRMGFSLAALLPSAALDWDDFMPAGVDE